MQCSHNRKRLANNYDTRLVCFIPHPSSDAKVGWLRYLTRKKATQVEAENAEAGRWPIAQLLTDSESR
eukprot:6198084-Pleurochrysis_carterae.AAC.7